jgi:hypothetical protein
MKNMQPISSATTSASQDRTRPNLMLESGSIARAPPIPDCPKAELRTAILHEAKTSVTPHVDRDGRSTANPLAGSYAG